jgi:hypothetical protein
MKMPQTAKVKTQLKTAVEVVKTVNPTNTEAKLAVSAWRVVIENPETTSELEKLALIHCRELEGAVVTENAQGRASHLQSLTALAAKYE